MLSSLEDYGKIAQMILNKGQLNNTRVLGCKKVGYMTANHISNQVDKGDLYLPRGGYGFGLGFEVRTRSGLSPEVGSKREHAWSGWADTGFWIDPEENMNSLFMIQDVINAGLPPFPI
ncbi:MAG: CubicO group peptidase (beta-lactamase class C family) [Arcticibacterium sp.]